MRASAPEIHVCRRTAQNVDIGSGTRSRVFRVLHATESAMGGISSYMDDLANLQQDAYGEGSIRIVLPEMHAEYMTQIGADRIHTFSGHGSRMQNSIALLEKVLPLIRSYQPDVVHVHSTYAGFVLRPFIRLLPRRPKVVYCPHGWGFKRDSSVTIRRVVGRVENVLAGLTDAIVCTSNGEYDSAMDIGIDPARLALILNGIPPLGQGSTEQIEWPDQRLRLLFVGRFDRQKGIDLFVEAMRQLRHVAFACVIGAPVVDGEEIGDLPDNVRLEGWQSRERLLSYYRCADLLVMPSRWEGFGLVAAEAMRSGLPVLGTRIGGLSDIVEHGVTGWLVEPDSAQAIVDTVASLDSDDLPRMGEAGRRRFQRMFSSERMFADMHELYERLVED